MSKFTVVIWEQRRIELEIEADNAMQADADALAIWDGICDDDTVDLINEIIAIDEHDTKSITVYDENGEEIKC